MNIRCTLIGPCIVLYSLTFQNFPVISLSHKNKSFSAVDASGVPLDHKLIKILNITNGIFIEVGASDGIMFSNTKLLEDDYGWKGILIEPSENLFDALCKNRPNSQCFQCALGSFIEDDTYAYGDFDGHLMASLTKRIDRPADKRVHIRSLQSILDECNITHGNFFSLDTEGYELHILKGIDFNRMTFDYLLIEMYIDNQQEIILFLAERGYEIVTCLSNYNKMSNPDWDGTHNDYLFKRKKLPNPTITVIEGKA